MIRSLYVSVRDRRVAVLKQMLNEVPGVEASLVVNDDFDRHTRDAVMRFQRQSGVLAADGAADENTWIALACEVPYARLRRLLEELRDPAYTQLLQNVQGRTGVANGLPAGASQSNTLKPTCLLEFIKANGKAATELARHFTGGHDGRHTVSPITTGAKDEYGGDVIIIAPLAGGRVLRWGLQDVRSPAIYILDIELANGQVLTLKDLRSVEPWIKKGLKIKETHGVKMRGGRVSFGAKIAASDIGKTLGTIFNDPPVTNSPQAGKRLNRTGLHVTVVKDRESWNKWMKQGRAGKDGNPEWFVDALDPQGLFACPGYRNKTGERKTEDGYPIP